MGWVLLFHRPTSTFLKKACFVRYRLARFILAHRFHMGCGGGAMTVVCVLAAFVVIKH